MNERILLLRIQKLFYVLPQFDGIGFGFLLVCISYLSREVVRIWTSEMEEIKTHFKIL